MMKKIFLFLTIPFFILMLFYAFSIYGFERGRTPQAPFDSKFQSGDIIFQTSTSAQSKAIQQATKSQYSHMGIIYQDGSDFYVYEAIQPVQLTPLKKWIRRGKNNRYVVKRLKNHEELLTPKNLAKIKKTGQQYRGKPYDLLFDWSDEKIYCSELVWKIYKEALGIEIGKLQQLKDFDLSHPAVQKKLGERYGNHPPLNATVISPESIFSSSKLVEVVRE